MTELLAMLKNWRAAYALDKAERELFDRIEAALSPSPSISEGEVEALSLAIAEAVMGNPYVEAVFSYGSDDADGFKSDIQIEAARVLNEAASKARATTEVEVTEEMVERAARAMEPLAFRDSSESDGEWDGEFVAEGRAQARGRASAALKAALVGGE